MAYTSATTAGFAARLFDRLSHLGQAVIDARRQNAVFKRTQRELNALTDRDLDDLGLTRADIVDVARKAAAQY